MMEVRSPSLQNVSRAREFDKDALTDAGNENVVIPPIAVPLDTEGMSTNVDNHQLNMATQPAYLGESQSSQEDFNNIYNCGETQLLHENQVELDDTQLPLAGETQPANGHEGFDDMVMLQNNTLTASPIPLTNAGQSVSHEPIHGTDAQPSQNSFDVPAFKPRGTISSNGIPASYQTNALTGERETQAAAEEPNEGVLITEAPTVNKHPEVHPAETVGQLGLTEGKEQNDTNSSEPQLGPLIVNVNGEGEADEGKMSKDGVEDDVSGKEKLQVVSEQDIQAMKGRKVVKKFGRKNYEGEVVDYDAENQWFKVVYEDGDEEDLELLEVKEILSTVDISTAKKKRSPPERAVNDQLARKRKRGPKKKDLAAGARKKSNQVKSPLGSKTKGLKRSAKSKSSPASAHESPVQSQPTSGAKRKRSSDVESMTSSKLELENVGGKAKRIGKKQNDAAKTPRKSPAKRVAGKVMPKKNLARKKGTRHMNLSKLPIVESKVEKALEAGEGGGGGKAKGKRRKIDVSEDQETFVGKTVEKDFGGTLYRGVVSKFDKKRKYYKVKYEDGDQEDLELEELKAVLVQ